MGSRFGGVKQVQPVGPHGELIIEYSAFDALRAGFGRLVLVIRKDIEKDFRDTIGRRLEARMDVQYVFQEMDTLPADWAGRGQAAPLQVGNRTKPWGTAHAALVAQPAVRGPFAVINADDFYGASAYRTLAAHFAASTDYAMVGYPLSQTLSEHGTVSRGLCATDAAGRLTAITEITKIEKTVTGARYTDATGQTQQLTGAEIVSMNFWGFTPAVFPQLEAAFAAFLASRGQDPKAEIYLPTTLSDLNARGEARIALHRSEDAWFGLTYKEDLASAQAAIRALVAAGKYPAPLWK
ncbi:nucleotidyltransferase [Oleiharenicola lentus]|uniref:Nucleotidyltransferase n=2 Tax=Oleiharenicola lentus TaxID=2508720 RepID=A0A4Q1CCW7_9BACT|nr:nucleotidyltransferase [Oleiharenicola lentus]